MLINEIIRPLKNTDVFGAYLLKNAFKHTSRKTMTIG